MDQTSNGQTGSIEQVWFNSEPADDEPNGYFYTKTEDGVDIVDGKPPPEISFSDEESSNVLIKSEITFDAFECMPASDVLEITDDAEPEFIDTLGAKETAAILDTKRSEQADTGKSWFSCDECGKEFNMKGSLNRHKMVHLGLKPFECDYCGMRFAQKCHMKQHQLTHQGDNMMPCDKCGVSFASKRVLQKHQRTHMKTANSNTFACEKCGKEFNRTYNLIRHERSHSGEKPFECDECGLRFAQKCHMEQHRLTHKGDKVVQCNECGVNFMSIRSLRKHQWTHIDGGSVAENQSNVDTGGQVDQHGADEKKTSCNLCGRSFSRRHYLYVHKRRDHSGNLPFSCDICERKFVDEKTLTRHVLCHSSDKSFGCDKCGMKFRLETYLKRHIRTHSDQTSFSGDLHP
ncbi:zinc finger protein OZF-like isoform X2 [Bradysia coprophila]|uniref:zinc finger protein OZF-like isoform X2 n=1 Tax=Bradysia coprophila TaxID=38358 RepID=UPI00187D7164|nr:zinc finger protein OZF-like isoform X2 [Bradysia coprophila]